MKRNGRPGGFDASGPTPGGRKPQGLKGRLPELLERTPDLSGPGLLTGNHSGRCWLWAPDSSVDRAEAVASLNRPWQAGLRRSNSHEPGLEDIFVQTMRRQEE
jgi:hypothetical protein